MAPRGHDMMASDTSGSSLAQAEEWFHAILLADGRRRAALAFGAGAIGAAAMQPLDLLPAFAISFPLLVWLLDGTASEGGGFFRKAWAAALLGWCFGFGYFIAGLWWLGAAFIAGGEDFIWLMPLGVVGLPAGLALFFALGVMLARLFWSAGALRIFALALGLGASEWLRGWLFTGFPWNGFGQAFANHLVLAQIISVIGAEGLGALAVLIFAAPAVLASGQHTLARWTLPLLAALSLALIAGFGLLRLETTGGSRVDFSTLPTVPNVKLRIMQPNVAQDVKNAQQNGMEGLERFFALSDTAKGAHASGVADVTHLIWPESPFPFVLERAPRALEAIGRFLPATTQLVTGAIRAEPVEAGSNRYRYFNALQVLDKTGITATYDKVHLVPFGEYLPFEGWLRRLGLEQFVPVVGGFTASPARKPVMVAGLPPVIPMICFESIFPLELAAGSRGDAVMLNVTNDAWFGQTFGPYQHLAQARLRAIEFGQPMVRAANTGISAVFDPYGREVAALPLGVADVLDAPLPTGLPNTLYRETTWYSFAAVMILCLGLALFGKRVD
jgi:apolipoprotein N-acyltransferase